MKASVMHGLSRARAAAVARLIAIPAIVALLALGSIGCGDDDPVAPQAFEAKGLVLRVGSADTVVDSSGVRGMIEVKEGERTGEISALFIAKSSGARSVPSGSDYTLSWTVADATVASIESVSAWSFKVHGKKAGTTTATFSMMRAGKAEYTSPAITIRVNADVKGWNTGDTLTYDYYDRDTNNVKQTAFKKTKVWIVLRSGISYEGRDNVSEILDITYDNSVEYDRDTLYLSLASDGTIYQYDLLRQLLARVEGGNAFSNNLQPLWVRVSSPGLASASSWSSIGVDSLYVPNVQAPGIPTSLNVTFWMNAYHLGRQGSTVPAGTYDDAVHTNHTLRLNVKLAGSIPVTVLNDSLHAHIEASAKDGILRQTFNSRKLLAEVKPIVSQPLPVTGYDMELKSVKRAK